MRHEAMDRETAFDDIVENRIKIIRGLTDDDDLFKDAIFPNDDYKKIVMRSLYSASNYWSLFVKKYLGREFPYGAVERNKICTSALYGLAESIYVKHFFKHEATVLMNKDIRDTLVGQGYYGLVRHEVKTSEKYQDDMNEDILKFINIKERIPRLKHTEATTRFPIDINTIMTLYANDMDTIDRHMKELYASIYNSIGDPKNPYIELYKHLIDGILEDFANLTIDKFDNFKDKFRPAKDLIIGFRIEQKLLTLNTIGLIRRLPMIINDREFFKKIYMK